MAAGPLPAPASVVSIAPRIEPHVVEVAVWYPFGAADEAVAAAAEKVAELLAAPDLGTPLVDTPDVDDDSRQAANTAMVQAVARAVIAEAQNIAAAAVRDLITKPGALRGLLPTEPPPDPGVPWLNNGVLAFTPDA
jgi:hypothetical protein